MDSFRISQFSPEQNSTPIFPSTNQPKTISQENHPNASENIPKPSMPNEPIDKNSNEITHLANAQEVPQNAVSYFPTKSTMIYYVFFQKKNEFLHFFSQPNRWIEADWLIFCQRSGLINGRT